MTVAKLFTFFLILLSSQDCWGGEITKKVICGNLRTGNAYRYCVDVEDESKRNLCVLWMYIFPNETSIELAEVCQQKNTTQASHVIDVNYFCITLPECVNVTYIDRLIELWIEFKVSGASDEPKEPLEKAPDSQSKTADNVKQDVDNENPNHNNTRTWLIPLCVCIAVVVVIAGLLLLYVCVYKPSRNKERNQGHRDVEEGQGNPDPNTIPLNQNEQCDASDQGEEGILRVEDGKPSDNDRADTESRQKTHADSPPLNVPKVVRVNSQTDDAQLLGHPQSNGHVGIDGDPGQGAGETSPLLCSPGEEGVLEGQDMKPADSVGTDPESCQKTHAEPPLVNGQHVSVNDKSKEPTADAQSPGPLQMNGGPPISNRAAEETTALLDKQALNKDTKPPELIDKGPNDMESRREL